jgi:hypothetical protein
MHYDIEAMRQMAAATPGDEVAIAKADYGKLLDALARGHRAEEALAKVRGLLLGTTATGIAA